MSAIKNYLADIETAADDLIRKETGISRFFGNYEWHEGIAGAYMTTIVETTQGFFCVQYWKRRNLVQLHKESQHGIFTPICSETI